MDKVFVILAIHNPIEIYLEEQLTSICQQSHRNFKCLCLIDGKDDKAFNFLKSLQLDDRFEIKHQNINLGSSKTFEQGLRSLPKDAHYIAFSDQDDIWHKDKLAICLDKLNDSTKKMVFHDARVICDSGNLIASSLMNFEKRNPCPTPFQHLFYNYCSGMSLFFRKDVILRALPIPKSDGGKLVLYDWWLSLFANANELLIFIPEALVDYRLHPSNQIGPKASNSLTVQKGIRALIKPIVKANYAKHFYLTRLSLCSALLKCGVLNQTAWRAFRKLKSTSNFTAPMIKALFKKDLALAYGLYVMSLGKFYFSLSKLKPRFNLKVRGKS